MKKLVFVIQLIFLYSSLAMADPVISLKTLLHEMTDRSALARWPENTYTCKQFSSYDRSSHNMTDKRAWFGNFDQGQFIRPGRERGEDRICDDGCRRSWRHGSFLDDFLRYKPGARNSAHLHRQ